MIDTPLLRRLIRSGKAGDLVARGVPGGFLLIVREGLDEDFLAAQRGGPRKFKHLEAVASYLKGMGASQFTVELNQWANKALNF